MSCISVVLLKQHIADDKQLTQNVNKKWLHVYIQVEKTLEMKKWSRNGKVIKQGRNVYDVLAM